MPGCLEYIFIQAGVHRFHGNFFTTGTGKHDYRAFRECLLHHSQHVQAVGPAQLIIGNYQVKIARFNTLLESIHVGDKFRLHIREFTRQCPGGEVAIIRIVIHQQAFQGCLSDYFCIHFIHPRQIEAPVVH